MKVSKGLLICLMGVGLLLNGISWAQEESSSGDTNNHMEPQQEQPAQEPVQEEQALAPEATPAHEEPSASDEGSMPDREMQQEAQQPVESAAPTEQPSAPESAPAKPAATPQPTQETPAAPQPQAQEAPAPETHMAPSDEAVMGLDTVDLEDPQGNWLFKRVWWERAEQKYEQIRAVVTQIMEQRSGFFVKRADLDKKVLDPFYINVGFRLGELLQKLNDMLAEIKEKTELQKSDVQTFENLEKEKKELEDLRAEVEKVNKQDEAVNKALLQFVDQINKLRHYEQQAWQDFKDIARVLDDKKARELFYRIDNAWQNIQKIQEYVEQTFSSSFELLVTDVTKQIDRIQGTVQELKERGIILQPSGAQEEEKEQEEEAPKGIVASIFEVIMRTFRDIVNAIVSVIRWPYDALFGSKPAVESEMPANEEVPAMPSQETAEPTTAQPQENPVASEAAMPTPANPVVPTVPSQEAAPAEAPQVPSNEPVTSPQETPDLNMQQADIEQQLESPDLGTQPTESEQSPEEEPVQEPESRDEGTE